MSEPLSVTSIILHASLPVQLIMLVLLVLSLLSWIVIFQRRRDYRAARLRSEVFEDDFWSGVDLNQLYQRVKQEAANDGGQAQIFSAGFHEYNRLRELSNAGGSSIMQGAERAMRVALGREQEVLEAHLPFLATVASVSPYIGLLGTVWGIMTAFLGLAQHDQVTLQVVAPDIAEALIATAMGLVAAIPAVVAYNRLSQDAESVFARYQTFAEEFSSILHRRAHQVSAH